MLQWIPSSDMVEALAFRFAVDQARTLGRAKVIVEGDVQKIVRMLQGEGSASN